MDIEQQYDKLLRYCYMKLRDPALAEDLTQETFTRFLESKHYQNTGKEMAYLYTIARNLCNDRFRARREQSWDELPPRAQDAFLPADEAPPIEDRLAVERALDSLDAELREAVTLRYIAELSVAEIAQTMELSRFAVRRRITAALTKLRKELEA